MLRADYSATHVIQRHENNIVCIPLTSDASLLGEPYIVKVLNAPYLVCKLIREAILRLLEKLGFTFTDFGPPSFVSRNPNSDMLARAVGTTNAAKVKHAHVYPRYLLAPKVLFPFTGPPLFGIQIDGGTRYELDCSVAQLMKLGLDPTGLYVRAKPQDNQPINPHRDPGTYLRLVGCVRRVSNNQLFLEDSPDVAELQAEQAWLEADLQNIETYLRLAGVPDVIGVLDRLKTLVFSVVGAQGLFNQFGKQVVWLQKKGNIPLALGLSCTIGEPLVPRSGVDAATYRQFSPPEFVFNPAGSKTHRLSNRGLEEFGPFDNEFFPTKRLNIAVVTPNAFQGDVEIFLQKFQDGMPRGTVFTRGFVRQYLLHGCKFAFSAFEPDLHEASAYRKACLRVLQTEPKPDLAFVIIKEQHKELQGDEDPYLVSKSVFMSQGVPVQEVEIETIRVPPYLESSIPYKLNNIGLACYAKLGGIPFVMAAVHGLAQELVIGIGSAKYPHWSSQWRRTHRWNYYCFFC